MTTPNLNNAQHDCFLYMISVSNDKNFSTIRLVNCYQTKDEALKNLTDSDKSVRRNGGYRQFALIEGYETGMYPNATTAMLFEWDSDTKAYVQINLPIDHPANPDYQSSDNGVNDIKTDDKNQNTPECFVYLVGVADELKFPKYTDFEIFCVYKTLEDAIERLTGPNADSISEDGYLPYAVIEGYSGGMHPTAHICMLFKWNHETNKYDQIDLPKDTSDDEGFFHRFKNVMVVG